MNDSGTKSLRKHLGFLVSSCFVFVLLFGFQKLYFHQTLYVLQDVNISYFWTSRVPCAPPLLNMFMCPMTEVTVIYGLDADSCGFSVWLACCATDIEEKQTPCCHLACGGVVYLFVVK